MNTLLRKQLVGGSSPLSGTNFWTIATDKNPLWGGLTFLPKEKAIVR